MNIAYGEVVKFVEPNFDNSAIGVTFDGRFIYDYNLMIEDYMSQHNCSIDDAINWIECNMSKDGGVCPDFCPLIVLSDVM